MPFSTGSETTRVIIHGTSTCHAWTFHQFTWPLELGKDFHPHLPKCATYVIYDDIPIFVMLLILFEKICCHLVARKLILPTGKGSCPLSYTTSFSVCTQVRVHGAVRAQIGACTQYSVHVHAPIRARTHPCTHCSVHTLHFFISSCFLSLSLPLHTYTLSNSPE